MIMMKANKQNSSFKLSSNISTFLLILLILVLLSFFFSFTFLLAIPIVFVSTLFLVKLKKKKGTKNESVVQDNLFQEKLQSSFNVSEAEAELKNQQSEIGENHEHDEAQLDIESRNFLVMDKTFEFNVYENKQQDDLISNISFPSDSQRSNGSIIGETFEIDHNGCENVSSRDSLASDTDGEDYDCDYDDRDEGFNRMIVDTTYNLDGKDSSLLSYFPSVDPILDDYDNDDEEEEEEDSLIEIDLPSRNLSGFLSESIYKQQDLMQLLEEMNDMNEDDQNLLEIDISM
ncbi:hypothetical protein TSUD_129190 [Trifolium subterraneum]|uniref:Transmembrane protein n=1 Tax=Trifolium subterraneum TaxID=3900 RepID=A0A2Z6P7Q6_TRISU|nr:hypothetical protein TSUD_129190 [Trifolium subterraneum]